MVENTEILVPDIIPYATAEFFIEFFHGDKKPVADTEFTYTVDKGKTLTGQTDENGLLKAKVKTPPPQNIALSLPA
jgi:phosphatidate phosphatase APP1